MLSKYDLFVSLGYVPDFSEGYGWLGYEYNPDYGAGVSDIRWWIDEGIRAFRKTITDQLASVPANITHVIPLSGGLDSRAILAGLLECLPSKQIATVTYGIPGAWDFEIADTLASKFKIAHESINLLNEKWDLDKIVSSAAAITKPVNIFEWYVRLKINRYFGVDCVYWGGFLGDSISGMDLLKTPLLDKMAAINDFICFSCAPNFKKKALGDAITEKINQEFPWQDMDKAHLRYEQQLDFGLPERFYLNYLANIKGYTVRTPFSDKTWVNFMLNVPYRWLYDQYLYKRILWEHYRELFKLPVKQKYGLPIFASTFSVYVNKAMARIMPKIIRKDPYGSHPRTNYINFTEALRNSGPFQDLVYTTLEDLGKRGIYEPASIKTWWEDHTSRRADNTRLLTNLSSMEIMLKAGRF